MLRAPVKYQASVQPFFPPVVMEIFDQVWKFVIQNPGAATVILMAGLAIFGGLWGAYTHFFPKSGPVATADPKESFTY